MTEKEIEEIFDECEKEGFVSYFPNNYDLFDEDANYIGKEFDVISRDGYVEEDDFLPTWTIRFEDGHEMEAYASEICKSCISNWVISDSVYAFIELISEVYPALAEIETFDGKIRNISGFTYKEWISDVSKFMLLISECQRLMTLYPKMYPTMLNSSTVVTALRNAGMKLKNI